MAYFVTFTLYGHWLHGDDRGSVDRDHATLESPSVKPNPARRGFEQANASEPTPCLTPEMRRVVTSAISNVCETRDWLLHAISVRTNHVHVVASGSVPPETMMTTFKAYSTRALREARMIANDRRLWTRHGSTKYVWTEQSLRNVWEYVTNMQDHI
jgi:REP element-mobilizing transposase RayT